MVLISKNTITCQISVLRNECSATFITKTLFTTSVLCSVIKVAEFLFLSTEIWHVMVFFEMSTTLGNNFFTLLYQKKDFIEYPNIMLSNKHCWVFVSQCWDLACDCIFWNDYHRVLWFSRIPLSKKGLYLVPETPQITNVAFSLEQGKTVFFLFHLSKVHVLGVLGTQYEKNPSVGSLSHFKLK